MLRRSAVRGTDHMRATLPPSDNFLQLRVQTELCSPVIAVHSAVSPCCPGDDHKMDLLLLKTVKQYTKVSPLFFFFFFLVTLGEV